MTAHNKSDIHEALRRKYADAPKLPADFLQRIHLADEKQKKTESRRRWIRMSSIGLSAAAVLVLAFWVTKPEPEMADPASESVTAHIQTQPQTHIGKMPDSLMRKADHTYVHAEKPTGVKSKTHRQKEAKPLDIDAMVKDALASKAHSSFEARSADQLQHAEQFHPVDERLPADEKVTTMDEIVLVAKVISSKRRAQLLAQLEEIQPEVYAYLTEVFEQANEYQRELDEAIYEAEQQALEMECY